MPQIFWVELIPGKARWVYKCREETAAPCPSSPDGVHAAQTIYQPGEKPDSSMYQACPRSCACGHVFGQALGIRYADGEPVYRRLDNPAEEIIGALPPGACYVAEPSEYNGWKYAGADGLNVVCVLPNGHHWYIDSRCSNCTMPNDNIHRCWVRHGTVGDTNLHVDKNGHTCRAGGGSIRSGDFHGRLQNGIIAPC